ncbi:MAG: UbiD family decarboxylase [Dehalococcoidia bacterium]|nr:UbiD family decarboxylase [Dehalococcoidia bacterium]
MYDSLRSFLEGLEGQEELCGIDVEVDPDWEVGTICREVFNRQGPAMVFNRVGSYKTPLVVGVLATLRRYALALGCPPAMPEIRARWERAYAHPIKPMVVSPNTAPCKQVKTTDIDLYQDPFPVPKWHRLDSNPYLGTLHAVITKDPDTGWTNLGDYRNELVGKDTLGALIIPFHHGALHWEKWRRLGKPMPVAIALGLEPYLNMVSVHSCPPGVDEYDLAGGLKGQPIEVTPAETSDLLVPANAEIVIEGEIPTDDFLPIEGPFGEYCGYMGDAVENCLYIKVKAVTHRESPYFQGTLCAGPPSEGNLMCSVGRSVALWHHLETGGLPGIVNVCVTQAGCSSFHGVVAIRKMYPGHVRDVMGLAWTVPSFPCKHVTVVDEDIDPWNPGRVEWAMATTVRAGRDIEIVRNVKSWIVDPSSPRPRGGQRGGIVSDWLGIDATRPIEAYQEQGCQFPESSDPPREWFDKVRERWTSYGF